MKTSIMAIIVNIAGTMAAVSPMLVWSAIVVAFALLIIFCICAEILRRVRDHRCRTVKHISRQTARCRTHSRCAVQMGSEREEMFVPGDPFPWKH